ncbi:MAG: hypothetical protein M1510_14320 [Nitrospirae bacterium]|nr:hypothetical protein [Nitrospirota bacterium]
MDNMELGEKRPFIVLLLFFSLFFIYGLADAKVTGLCVNCHTMHNSQNGTVMSGYGGSGQGPNESLTRGDCMGCHGMGPTKIVNVGGSNFPQVFHSDSSDLAGGNFKYIQTYGNNRGHNVKELGIQDPLLNTGIPGAFKGSFHNVIIDNSTKLLTCAGSRGCHGKRLAGTDISGLQTLKGAHHKSVAGVKDTASDVYNSYRYLMGVKGYESSNWQNTDSANHNEYFGANTPLLYYSTCTNACHASGQTGQPVIAPQNTMSGFCATCHGNFHSLSGSGAGTYGLTSGIGPTSPPSSPSSTPFIRHPTDVVIPIGGEYSAYTSYSVEAPVARQTVYSAPSGVVNPGSDVVMCLSCHMSHASKYPSMLRWDYTQMVAGGGGSGGCFTCHTQKN